ncbi:aminotransferase class IV [Streptomyces sp. NPDC055005]
MKIWLGGTLRDVDDAKVSVLDHGLTVGDGVFETLRASEGQPFALTRHLDRLTRSARGLGLPDSDRGEAGPTLIVAVGPTTRRPDTTAVITVPWVRNERSAVTGLKTTSYAENVVALARAHAAGASEALFGNTVGRLCEGTGSNVFVVLDGQAHTPPVSSGCLAGITRDLTVRWIGAKETDLPLDALEHAEEVFLTSTLRDVQAVHRIDGRDLAAPGPVTARAMRIFDEQAGADLDP